MPFKEIIVEVVMFYLVRLLILKLQDISNRVISDIRFLLLFA